MQFSVQGYKRETPRGLVVQVSESKGWRMQSPDVQGQEKGVLAPDKGK
jgi:hypothetical protein